MSKLQQKTSYLKGLAEGLGLEQTSPEGRLLIELINAMEEVADELADVKEMLQDFTVSIDALDESVGDLEEDYWGWDDLDEDECDNDFIQLECPKCHEKVYFEEEALEDDTIGQVNCPRCGEVLLSMNDIESEADPV